MAESLSLQGLDDQADGDIDEAIIQTPEEYISAYAYSSATITAAYYNTTTLELSLAHETVDLKPEFWHLKNLYRQLNHKVVLASGPVEFLRTLMCLMNLPNKEPAQYSVNRLKSTNHSPFLVYTNNAKSLVASRKRIYELRLSHMRDMQTEMERQNFIQTLVPMNQTLLVQTLGNLLSYLDDNWKHMFLRNDRHPVISKIIIHHLESQMLMDDASFHALQIFNMKDHPSSFNKTVLKREDQSLFHLINKCASRLGAMELRMVLQQPIRDLVELKARHATIEWFINAENNGLATKLRVCLKNVTQLSEQFQKLVNDGRARVNIWKNYKRGLYYGINAGNICKDIVTRDGAAVAGTIMESLAMFIDSTTSMQDALDAVNLIVDLQSSESNNRFTVKYGIDATLDEKKQKLLDLIGVMEQAANAELDKLPLFITQIRILFIAELGFVLCKSNSRR